MSLKTDMIPNERFQGLRFRERERVSWKQWLDALFTATFYFTLLPASRPVHPISLC
jgi:hypothetical protein